MEVTPEMERITRILAEAANDWNITLGELIGSGRKREYVEARRYAAQQLRSMGLGLKQVGHHLGGRDHATVANLLCRRER